MALPFIKLVRDVPVTIALPAAASTSVNTAAVDIGVNGVPIECVFEVPALNATILPDTRTMTSAVEVSNVANFASFDTIATAVQTGAGGIGAAAISKRAVIPPVYQYVRLKVTSGVSTTTAAAFTGSFAIVP